MRFFFTFFVVFIFLTVSGGNIGLYYPLPNRELPVCFIHSEKEIWTVTNTAIYKVEKSFFVLKYKMNDSITCAADYGSSILIGTSNGLIKFDKYKNSVVSIEIPINVKPFVKDIFKDLTGKIWICTKNTGTFIWNNDGPIKMELDKPGLLNCNILSIGTIGVVANNAFYYNVRNSWQKLNDTLLSESFGIDTLRKVYIDTDGFIWIIKDSNTKIYQIQTSVGKIDTLIEINSYVTNGTYIKEFVKIPDVGILYNTSKGFFIRYGILSANPLFETVTNNDSYTIQNFMQQDITKNFSIQTGFRSADFIYYDETDKRTWFINSNGALGLNSKELKQFVE